MICGNCSKSATNFCGGCGNVRYCFKECQIIVRKVHKIVCVKKNDLPSLLKEETNEEESEILPVSIDYREVMDLVIYFYMLYYYQYHLFIMLLKIII